MKVLLTGAAGFLGEKLHLPFLAHGHEVVRTDIAPLSCSEPFVQADLIDPSAVKAMVNEVDTLVIAHMSPKHETDPALVYRTMGVGTINLFEAALQAGIRKLCLISSVDAVRGYPPYVRRMRDFAPKADELYGLGKTSQEQIAEYYSRKHDMDVTVLRIGYVIDALTLTNKYDAVEETFAPNMIDRLDVAEACVRFLERPGAGYEIYYILGTSQNGKFEVEPTWDALGWQPTHLAKKPPVPAVKIKPNPIPGVAQPAK
ncbi:MAG: NAD(P)-dependent oxidoreductase [Planctomycetota bacterium]